MDKETAKAMKEIAARAELEIFDHDFMLEKLYGSFLRWREGQEAFKLLMFEQFCEQHKKRQEQVRRQVDAALPEALRNGEKGEGEVWELELPEAIDTYSLIGLEDVGLCAAGQGHVTAGKSRLRCISGKPAATGEFEIAMPYTYAGWEMGIQMPRHVFRLTIIPALEDLWQNIPTPKNIEYYKADTDMYFHALAGTAAAGGAKRIVAASLRGRSHAHRGKPRDDHFAADFDAETGWHILAVSDGAGSAAFSRKGSEIASTAAVSACRHAFRQLRAHQPELARMAAFVANSALQRAAQPEDEQLRDAVHQSINRILLDAARAAHEATREEAEGKSRPIQAYAATLLLAVCKKFASGWLVASFAVGDGAIALLRSGGGQLDSTLLAMPDEGEYAGQTRFITGADVHTDAGRVHVAACPDFAAIVLMTDGVSDAKFEAPADLDNPQKWYELWQELWLAMQHGASSGSSPDAALLQWLNFPSEDYYDDRTIALIF